MIMKRLNKLASTSSTVNYKYNEDKYCEELLEYVSATYGQHYATDKFQATEFISC